MALDSKRARELGKKSGEARRKKAQERKAAQRRRRQAGKLHRQSMWIFDAMDLWPEFAADSWRNWRCFLKALFGVGLSESELETFKAHTRREAPEHAFTEAWVIVGRRGGKSRIAALTACYLALFRDYTTLLAPGERGVVMCLAADRRQARQVFGYIRGLIQSVPMLQDLVEVERKESIDLKNSVAIEVHTASFRTVRGYTTLAAICDEIAFWRDESSANPDAEVLTALRPAMATVPGAVLLSISTPYARRGELWKAYDRHYGQDSDVLVWQADTRSMNPTVPGGVIESAYENDAVSAAAEYGAEFRRDVEAFLSPEALTAVTVPGRIEIPRQDKTSYTAFTDPSGGSQDSFTLAIAHTQDNVAVLDLVREVKPPFSPEQVCKDYAAVLKSYGIRKVAGDRYAGEWPREQFQEHGVEYVPSKKTKSDIYRELLAPVNSGRVELLDNKKLRAQLEGLERRVARGGKDSIDHGPGAHDDLANSAAGAVTLALEKGKHVPGIPIVSLRQASYWAQSNPTGERTGWGGDWREMRELR